MRTEKGSNKTMTEKERHTLALQSEMSRLDAVISGKYLGDGSNVPENELHIADVWLEDDISSSLTKSEDMYKTREEIETILQESWAYNEVIKIISIDRAFKRATVRADFATALRSVKNGSALSGILRWSFSEEDLKALAKLHKANRFRKKIEDLLEDCNFHEEYDLMSEHNYSRWFGKATKKNKEWKGEKK